MSYFSLFQSTHPARGATVFIVTLDGALQDFNPRTPRGVRPGCGMSDDWRKNFNPRTPRGVRPAWNPLEAGALKFQSTHPASTHVVKHGHDTAISIHAPREGCDPCVTAIICLNFRFQSTHPARGATVYKGVRQPQVTISIHAPREGCDCFSSF